MFYKEKKLKKIAFLLPRVALEHFQNNMEMDRFWPWRFRGRVLPRDAVAARTAKNKTNNSWHVRGGLLLGLQLQSQWANQDVVGWWMFFAQRGATK